MEHNSENWGIFALCQIITHYVSITFIDIVLCSTTAPPFHKRICKASHTTVPTWRHLLPYSIHRNEAKLVDSAQLKPWLNPEWYPYGKVIMISPSSCTIESNGIEYLLSIVGDINVILWRKKAGHCSYESGKNPATNYVQECLPCLKDIWKVLRGLFTIYSSKSCGICTQGFIYINIPMSGFIQNIN